MKNIIIAVLAAFALNNSLMANPIIIAELQKVEAATERQLAAKDDQIAAMAAEIAAKDSQLAAMAAEIVVKDSQLKTDLGEIVKIKFNQAMVDAKSSITKLTDDLLSKIKEIKK